MNIDSDNSKRSLHDGPCVIEFDYRIAPEDCLLPMAKLPGVLMLDSAIPPAGQPIHSLGRYSFLMADPFQIVEMPVGSSDPWTELRECWERFQEPGRADLPPMQGGLAGLFGYDLNRSLEKLPAPGINEFEVPAISVGAYDVVLAWDHLQRRAWIISQGYPELSSEPRRQRAIERAQQFQQIAKSVATRVKSGGGPQANADPISNSPWSLDQLAPSFQIPHPQLTGLYSNFQRDDYLRAVQRCIDYIHAGDVFQINLSQRLLHRATLDSATLYGRLRRCNPAPFSSYYDLPGTSAPTQIVSASPERLFSIRNGQVETRPIKGTRRRSGHPMIDIRERNRLLASVKDRAENTMIVDLMRNDLSPVCRDDSIEVTQLCELESYQSVLHLVSAVQGTLLPDRNPLDVLAAVFPGGSITGAPKIRAMQIIAELEPTARGAYCGSLGYLGFNSSADLNILIRTITASRGWWQIPVGGGIVSQSNPEREYEETWTKAAGMLQAWQGS